MNTTATAVKELVETLAANGVEVLHADDNLLFVKDVNGNWYGVRFN